jgi:hypothetical protein
VVLAGVVVVHPPNLGLKKKVSEEKVLAELASQSTHQEVTN